MDNPFLNGHYTIPRINFQTKTRGDLTYILVGI